MYSNDYTLNERIKKLQETRPEYFKTHRTRKEDKKKENEANQGAELGGSLLKWSPERKSYEFEFEDACLSAALTVYKARNKESRPCIELDDLKQEARFKAIELARAGKEVFRTSLLRHLWRYVQVNTPGAIIDGEADVETV